MKKISLSRLRLPRSFPCGRLADPALWRPALEPQSLRLRPPQVLFLTSRSFELRAR